MKKPITEFIETHYKHFNAASLKDASKGYSAHIESGGKMLMSIAGAMSTAEIGVSLAEMIRQDKVHIISCTGANLEEDLTNLIAHKHYKRIPHYRELSVNSEVELMNLGLNRVTDTCIPEDKAFKKIQHKIYTFWKKANDTNQRFFPHEFLYQMLLAGIFEEDYEIDPKNSWLLAAAKKNLPLVVPGWEDSTLGNVFTSYCIKKEFTSSIIKSGIEYMIYLTEWYKDTIDTNKQGVGFFQIGGGIAGDFPICVVPMMSQDLGLENIPYWQYYCQISDSTTSYGSYSGAVPNEKITWGKLKKETPKYIIESDATIVAPLIFAWVLGW